MKAVGATRTDIHRPVYRRIHANLALPTQRLLQPGIHLHSASHTVAPRVALALHVAQQVEQLTTYDAKSGQLSARYNAAVQ